MSTDYIALMLKAPSTQKRMEKAIKGVAVRGINIGDVRALQFPLPSYSEQLEIVQRVRSLFDKIKHVEEEYLAINKKSNQLDQSILAKAFRGQLVPQDPNDEPASILLERIRTEREKTQKKKGKGGRRGKG